jgi:hypothetical protein
MLHSHDSHPDRVAWIVQDFFDPAWEEPGRTPAICAEMAALPPFGRAHGLIDSDAGLVEEGEWDAIEDGIEWARERASRVLVRIGHSGYYSAGREPSLKFPPWPPTEEAIRSETLRTP